MKLFFLHYKSKIQKEEPGKRVVVTVQEPEHNTSEGSEFLDDAIRMVDQPLAYSRESGSAQSPVNFLLPIALQNKIFKIE